MLRLPGFMTFQIIRSNAQQFIAGVVLHTWLRSLPCRIRGGTSIRNRIVSPPSPVLWSAPSPVWRRGGQCSCPAGGRVRRRYRAERQGGRLECLPYVRLLPVCGVCSRRRSEPRHPKGAGTTCRTAGQFWGAEPWGIRTLLVAHLGSYSGSSAGFSRRWLSFSRILPILPLEIRRSDRGGTSAKRRLPLPHF